MACIDNAKIEGGARDLLKNYLMVISSLKIFLYSWGRDVRAVFGEVVIRVKHWAVP